jgi:hypothetical protein
MRVGFGYYWLVCGQSSTSSENGLDPCRGGIGESLSGSLREFIIPGWGLPPGISPGTAPGPCGVEVTRRDRPVPPPAGRGLAPIYANLTSRYSYPASVLVYFNHLAWSLPVAFCKIFCNEIPAFETFTQRQNRIYCAPEQIKCKRCLPPQIRLGGIFFTDVRATIPLPLEYAGVFLIPERRWGFLSLVCAEGIPRGKKNVLARQLQR